MLVRYWQELRKAPKLTPKSVLSLGLGPAHRRV